MPVLARKSLPVSHFQVRPLGMLLKLQLKEVIKMKLGARMTLLEQMFLLLRFSAYDHL